jgi:DNA-binding response OmpR family regulator
VALFARKQRRFNRLLVVEDEPLVAFDTEYFLRDEGFDVVATLDRVEEAVALIRAGTAIDLVLADINLADGSGIDVAKAAAAAEIAVLFVTGQCPVDARTLADGCLGKPYAQRDLALAIAAIEAVHGGMMPKRLPTGFTLFKTLP